MHHLHAGLVVCLPYILLFGLEMKRYVGCGLAAAVVGVLYLASNIFLLYDANAALHHEISELQVNMSLFSHIHPKINL